MTDTTLIWKVMVIMILDSHPEVYQYIKGQHKSREAAIMRVTEIAYKPFMGAYNISKVRGVAREFLKMKEGEYKAGRIKVKSIY